ncbi:DUF998 domain-containing protein [Agromyces sp. NPDC058110]|uniref:DUF998 domain-containing protein n=1 Tax=Agromyces sp. NPDC058110 TaxID=3346345 RepID=UPI0036DCAF33
MTETISQSAETPGPARPSRRSESEAVFAALGAGAGGALYGLVIALVVPVLTLAGQGDSLGTWAAIAAGIVAAAASAVSYWRARSLPEQQWRRTLPSWTFSVNAVSVSVAHGALALVGVLALFRVLSLGFIGLPLSNFWAVVLSAVTIGLSAYISYLSAAQTTTQRMSSLMLSFIAIGTLTAMVTTPDPEWWTYHFSQLGTYDDLSSWVFNGTLICAGLLVTTFAVYVARDLRVLAAKRGEEHTPNVRVVPTLFVVMGVMLACVGIFPVDLHLVLHNLSASGMALVFLVLLFGGRWLLRGMPRTYFVSAWIFAGAMIASVVLFAVGYFTLTAFEIIVFALIFGWIAVFIRFLRVAALLSPTDAAGAAS